MEHERLPFDPEKDQLIQQKQQHDQDKIQQMQYNYNASQLSSCTEAANENTNAKLLDHYKKQLMEQYQIEQSETASSEQQKEVNTKALDELIQKQTQKEQIFKKILPKQQQIVVEESTELIELKRTVEKQQLEIQQLNNINQEIMQQLNKVVSTFSQKFDIMTSKIGVLSEQFGVCEKERKLIGTQLQQMEMRQPNDNQQIHNNCEQENKVIKQQTNRTQTKDTSTQIDEVKQQDSPIGDEQLQQTNKSEIKGKSQQVTVSEQQDASTLQKNADKLNQIMKTQYQSQKKQKVPVNKIEATYRLQSGMMASIEQNKQLMKRIAPDEISDEENVQISDEARKLIDKFNSIKEMLGM